MGEQAPALQDILDRIKKPKARSGFEDRYREEAPNWVPNSGRQREAYYSNADVLLYGGQPGGGKSQLLLGLALTKHKRSLIMRRKYGDLERLIEDALKLHGSRQGYNGSPPPKLRLGGDRVIYFRAAQHAGDEQGTMGQGRDFLGIDEATHFAESQVRFLMGWVRAEDEKQHCRVVLATNPPLTAEGMWVHTMFAPWIDPNFPNPAKPGELRWVLSDAHGKDEWVDGPEDAREINDKTVRPMSRTYIPAAVKDNPYYAGTDYERTLDNMAEPFRSILLGGFRTSFKDQESQVIPTHWIEESQARWKPDGHKDYAMTAIAFDPAGGGRDEAVIAWRHGGWYAKLVTEQGPQTADGSKAASKIIEYRRDNAVVVVDAGGGAGYGFGGTTIMRLRDNGVQCRPFHGHKPTTARAQSGQHNFANMRALAWWRMREALDPDQQGGSVVALPPDAELRADLAAPTFEMTISGILLEDKDDLRKRLGRSPGKGDAVVMCLSEGDAAKRSMLVSPRGLPKAVLGHQAARRR